METAKKQGKSKKVLISVIAGVVALTVAGSAFAANAGLIFKGTTTVDIVGTQLIGLDSKVQAYEQNEQVLLAKISDVQATAIQRITAANELLSNLRATLNAASVENAGLRTDITGLEAQISELEVSLATLQVSFTNLEGENKNLKESLEMTIAAVQLLVKQNAGLATEIVAKNTEIGAQSAEITKQKAEVDRLTAQLNKANDKIKELEVISATVASSTYGNVPLTSVEIDAIDTTVPNVE